jgi:hypothetical protein
MPDMPELPKMNKIVPNRIVIYPRDVQNITGCRERTARHILQQIRIANNKSPDHFVTITEFCAFRGLKEEEVRQFLV